MIPDLHWGVDVGSTLTKVAIRESNRPPRFQLVSRGPLSDVARLVETAMPVTLGLTGGGAAALASLLNLPSVQVNEFTAWGTGASQLLSGEPLPERYLLVSLGTGTSMMLVEGHSVVRKGGTALGGGTILGLGAAMLGTPDFSHICSLAEAGSRDSVDLLVRDIYPDSDRPLKGDLTAASFGRLGREFGTETRPEDMACSVMRLVGENVALIAGGHAKNAGVQRIIYGGSTLRRNPALALVLEEVTGLLGLEARVLEDGEFAGALGAMEWAPRTDKF